MRNMRKLWMKKKMKIDMKLWIICAKSEVNDEGGREMRNVLWGKFRVYVGDSFF